MELDWSCPRVEAELENAEEGDVAERYCGLPVLRDCAAGRGNVKLIDELVENAKAKDAMVDGGLEKLGYLFGEFAVGWIVEPTQLGDTTHKLDELSLNKALEGGSRVSKVRQDVVANFDPLRYCEVIPVSSDKRGEGISGNQQGVVGL